MFLARDSDNSFQTDRLKIATAQENKVLFYGQVLKVHDLYFDEEKFAFGYWLLNHNQCTLPYASIKKVTFECLQYVPLLLSSCEDFG